MGIDDGQTITRDVVKVNLQQQDEIPTEMARGAVASVYRNTIYVAGVGVSEDEIWKFRMATGWMKCRSLVQGRSRHCATFIDEILYICGGVADSTQITLDSVEAYNAVSNTCDAVGKLVHCVCSAGNCVAFKNSLFIFGGMDIDNITFNHVQVYNTKQNTCTMLSKPMPHNMYLMQAAILETSVILLGQWTCLIFNFETENWQERKQFKTDSVKFGLALENEKIFVIGGGLIAKDASGTVTCNGVDEVRYVPLQDILDDKPAKWKIQGKLPKPSIVNACANMRFLV